MEEDIQKLADLRKRIVLTAISASNAHIASAFSLTEILYVLYLKGIVRVDPSNPTAEDRDRLILSKGHGSLALYSVLNMAGFIDDATLASFSKPGFELGGEPVLGQVPGIEASTGSLGHGLSLGMGMALALKGNGAGSRVFVIVGDGECEEGSIWEAAMSAAAYKLDNLVVIVDSNHIQKMGRVSDITGIDDWGECWKSFGWSVNAVDGHDIEALERCFMSAGEPGKPRAIIADTVKGKGVSLMENNAAWHWRLPNKREMKKFKAELGITDEEVEACRKHI